MQYQANVFSLWKISMFFKPWIWWLSPRILYEWNRNIYGDIDIGDLKFVTEFWCWWHLLKGGALRWFKKKVDVRDQNSQNRHQHIIVVNNKFLCTNHFCVPSKVCDLRIPNWQTWCIQIGIFKGLLLIGQQIIRLNFFQDSKILVQYQILIHFSKKMTKSVIPDLMLAKLTTVSIKE